MDEKAIIDELEEEEERGDRGAEDRDRLCYPR